MPTGLEYSVARMPDFTVRGIDNDLAERIKEVARGRNWSINDTVLELLRQALAPATASAPVAGATAKPDHQDVARLSGTWANDEADALRAAIAAFESLPPDESPFSGKP